MLAFYSWAIKVHFENIEIINHKFLLRGHTHMKVNDTHSIIEGKKKQLKSFSIMPYDWVQFVRNCNPTKPFVAFDLEIEDFKKCSSLLEDKGCLVNRKKTTDGENFSISSYVWSQFRKPHLGIAFFKTDFNEEFKSVDLRRNTRKSLIMVNNVPPIRRSPKPIAVPKHRDLMTALQWVPSTMHSFYKSISTTNNDNNSYSDVYVEILRAVILYFFIVKY